MRWPLLRNTEERFSWWEFLPHRRHSFRCDARGWWPGHGPGLGLQGLHGLAERLRVRVQHESPSTYSFTERLKTWVIPACVCGREGGKEGGREREEGGRNWLKRVVPGL